MSNLSNWPLVSSPEPKAQVSFSDHLLSVICLSFCPSVRKLFTFSSSSPEPLATGQYLKIFFSRTTGPKSTKLSTEQRFKFAQWSTMPFSKGHNCKIVKILWSHLNIFYSKTMFLAHLSWKLKWAFLITFSDHLSSVVCLSVCPSVCKLFTFSSSSPEPLGQFQPNLAQSILGSRGFKFD